jgi:hypothetical protein
MVMRALPASVLSLSLGLTGLFGLLLQALRGHKMQPSAAFCALLASSHDSFRGACDSCPGSACDIAGTASFSSSNAHAVRGADRKLRGAGSAVGWVDGGKEAEIPELRPNSYLASWPKFETFRLLRWRTSAAASSGRCCRGEQWR